VEATLQIDGFDEPLAVVAHHRASRRIRVAVPGLVGNPWLARRIEPLLRALPGAERVRADPRSGRAQIDYRDGLPLRPEKGRLPRLARARAALSPSARAAQPSVDWHALPLERVLAELSTTPLGLGAREAAVRLHRYGANVIEAEAPRSRLQLVLSQLGNLPSILLIGSSVVSALVGNLVDAGAILVVVSLNAAIGYTIERKNEELLASWRRLEGGDAEVVRDGRVRTVLAADLVPGDLVRLRAGDVVPADLRIVEAERLTSDESTLTGESMPEPKGPEPVAAGAPLAERSSMLHAGTTIASGHGRALVVATGRATELGAVRALVDQATAPASPLTRQLDRLSNHATLAAVGAAALTAGFGLLHGRAAATLLRSAVALGIAAIPEGLPVVATAALVRSMQRMRDRGMVVRRLAAAETLGGVTVICSDKTGTLTLNDMRLEVLDVGGRRSRELRACPDGALQDPATLALVAAVLNSDVDVRRRGRELELSGSSTERALILAAHAAGLDPTALGRAFPRRRLVERSAGVAYVVSLHDSASGERLAFVKGAPEQVLALCSRCAHGPLDEATRRRVLAANEELASDGLRVLATAWQRLAPGAESWNETCFSFLGLLGLRDPLRPGAAEAVATARRAGIRTVIVTGDQLRTAEAIARAVGLTGEALDGAEARRLLAAPPPERRARLGRVSVIARVSPADKVALVRALGESGEVVAMAGDGVNDAAALKAADIGIAIGLASSDLARAVADVVLTNEDLRSILAAVGEGRIVQDNLRRSLRFLFATNLSEMALVVGAAALGLPDPLTALELLWINLLTDTLPGLALALEPGDPAVLDRPPVPPGSPLLSRSTERQVARDGLLLGAAGALGFVVGGPALAFTALVGAQLSYTLACRAPRVRAGRRFAALVGGAAALQSLTLLPSPLRRLLSLGPPSLLEAGGLAAGLLGPWLSAAARDGETIVRTAARSPVLEGGRT
jgi:Ca2+-transporting ATPase